jgi:hypothetical protein
MIVHRRTWVYRLAGQNFARTISFKVPVTAHHVREALQRMFGARAFELWSH